MITPMRSGDAVEMTARPRCVVLALSGTMFGAARRLDHRQPAGARAPACRVAAGGREHAVAPPRRRQPSASAARSIDTARAADLERAGEGAARPTPSVRAELGNLYFDARAVSTRRSLVRGVAQARSEERRTSARISPSAYYYTNELDRALTQLDHSLAIDPRTSEDAAQSGHHPGVRQAGSGGRAGVVGAGRRDRAGQRGGARARQGLDAIKAPPGRRRRAGQRRFDGKELTACACHPAVDHPRAGRCCCSSALIVRCPVRQAPLGRRRAPRQPRSPRSDRAASSCAIPTAARTCPRPAPLPSAAATTPVLLFRDVPGRHAT